MQTTKVHEIADPEDVVMAIIRRSAVSKHVVAAVVQKVLLDHGITDCSRLRDLGLKGSRLWT